MEQRPEKTVRRNCAYARLRLTGTSRRSRLLVVRQTAKMLLTVRLQHLDLGSAVQPQMCAAQLSPTTRPMVRCRRFELDKGPIRFRSLLKAVLFSPSWAQCKLTVIGAWSRLHPRLLSPETLIHSTSILLPATATEAHGNQGLQETHLSFAGSISIL